MIQNLSVRRHAAFLLLLTAVFTTAAYAQTPTPAPTPLSEEAKAIRQQTFDKVWSTVNEKHYDPTFGGVDWAKVREKYEPQALAAVSDQQFHGMLRDMLGELKLSHFEIMPPSAALKTQETQRGFSGLQVLMIDGTPIVKRVEAGSPAEKAGIRTGYALVSIDGKPWQRITEPVEKALAARSAPERTVKLYRETLLGAVINGKPATEATVEFEDGAGKTEAYKFTRSTFSGEWSQPMGNFPAQPVEFESKILPGDIGYIRANIWVMPQLAKFRSAIAGFEKAKGLVIDLRGNPGGVGGLAMGFAGNLAAEPGSLGSMRTRSGNVKFLYYPQANAFTGPVVILTDHGSGSTSELFAAGLQESGRAKVVGDTSAGMVLPSMFEKLPTGYLFQYAFADFRTTRDILLEGRGVRPDVEVPQTRAALLAGRDAQLDAAVKLILGSGGEVKK